MSESTGSAELDALIDALAHGCMGSTFEQSRAALIAAVRECVRERDEARKLALELCNQYCGKHYHGACIASDCPRRAIAQAEGAGERHNG